MGMALFRQDPDDSEEEEDGASPGNPDQPPLAELCPIPPGVHDWIYTAYARTCSKCGADEAAD